MKQTDFDRLKAINQIKNASDDQLKYMSMLMELQEHKPVSTIKEFLIPDENIDYARPIGWVKEATDLRIDSSFIVWHYKKGDAFGNPLDLTKELIYHIVNVNKKILERY